MRNTLNEIPELTLGELTEAIHTFERQFEETGVFPIFVYLENGQLAAIAPDHMEDGIVSQYDIKKDGPPALDPDQTVYLVESPDTTFEEAQRLNTEARERAWEIINNLGLEEATSQIGQALGLETRDLQEAAMRGHIATEWLNPRPYLGEIEGLEPESFLDQLVELFEDDFDDDPFDDAPFGVEETGYYPPHVTPEPGLRFLWGAEEGLERIIVKTDPNLGCTFEDEVVTYTPSTGKVSVFCTRSHWDDMVANHEIRLIR